MVEFVPNKKERGKIYVNKLAAAERQLNAAIRMFFLEEDDLAIHLVASASYNLFSDLLSAKGKEEAEWPQLYGLLRTARDYHFGELLKDEIEREWPQGSLEMIEDWAQIFRDDEDLDIDAVVFSADPERTRTFWREMRSSYNFLKHADKDNQELLDVADINNEDLILRAVSASLHLNLGLTDEAEFFVSYIWSQERGEKKPIRGIRLQYLFRQLERREIFALARKNLCYARVDDDVGPLPNEASKNAAAEYANWLKKYPDV